MQRHRDAVLSLLLLLAGLSSRVLLYEQFQFKAAGATLRHLAVAILVLLAGNLRWACMNVGMGDAQAHNMYYASSKTDSVCYRIQLN